MPPGRTCGPRAAPSQPCDTGTLSAIQGLAQTGHLQGPLLGLRGHGRLPGHRVVWAAGLREPPTHAQGGLLKRRNQTWCGKLQISGEKDASHAPPPNTGWRWSWGPGRPTPRLHRPSVTWGPGAGVKRAPLGNRCLERGVAAPVPARRAAARDSDTGGHVNQDPHTGNLTETVLPPGNQCPVGQGC